MNWFKYRLPNTTDIVCGASESICQGFGNGFVIAPFENPSDSIITIPFDMVPDASLLLPEDTLLPASTSKSAYLREIEGIKADLKGKRGKTVAAKVTALNLPADINATFKSLCESYPDAFIFSFSSHVTGTWIGATPELLLQRAGSLVSTMALAGTRPRSAGNENKPWDEKNTDEQKMVSEFIKECLEEYCINIKIHPTFTKAAGNIEHICTPIEATLPDKSDNAFKSLLAKLSPTPAVCGNDRMHSLDLIKTYENFDRELYGGFCGPSRIDGKTDLYVILRTAKCNEKAVSVFSGGGITSLSIPEEEWTETELKSQTIINTLIHQTNKLKTSENET